MLQTLVDEYTSRADNLFLQGEQAAQQIGLQASAIRTSGAASMNVSTQLDSGCPNQKGPPNELYTTSEVDAALVMQWMQP